jgi:hypothetical protein
LQPIRTGGGSISLRPSVNYCATSERDATIIAPISAYHRGRDAERYRRYKQVLIFPVLRWQGSAEAASLLPQAAALLPCAGYVAGLRAWHRWSGKLLQPSENLGSALCL